MRASDIIFEERVYIGSATPPTTMEDCSRFKRTVTTTKAATLTQLPSGLWYWLHEDDQYTFTMDIISARPQWFESWIRIDELASSKGHQSILWSPTTATVGVTIQLNQTTDELQVQERNAWNSISTTNAIPIDLWKHVVVNLDGQAVTCYINGDEEIDGNMGAVPVDGMSESMRLGSQTAGYGLTGGRVGTRMGYGTISQEEAQNRFEETRGWFRV